MNIFSFQTQASKNGNVRRYGGLFLWWLLFTGAAFAQSVAKPDPVTASMTLPSDRATVPSDPQVPRAPSVGRTQTLTNTASVEPASYSLYTPELSLMAQTSPSTASNPSIAQEYIWFGGQPVAQIDLATNTTRTTFTDHLGTPILQTDSAGGVVWRAEYDPYGDISQMRVGNRIEQPLRAPGQEAAMTVAGGEENYNIFRWYSSRWGRYTQADPIPFQDSTNLFAYAIENPIRFSDPRGLKVRACCKIIPAFGVVGARHCFFQFDDGPPWSVGLHQTENAVGYVLALAALGMDRGTVEWNHNFDRDSEGANCSKWPAYSNGVH